MTPLSSAILEAWERRASDDLRASLSGAYTYLGSTISELVADDATWTINTSRGHPALLAVGDTAFVLLSFAAPAGGVTMNGALHPLDERIIRVSFNDRRGDEVVLQGGESATPMIRQWAFDWHGRLQLPIEYWLPLATPVRPDHALFPDLELHDRQRMAALRLARAAGWPMPEPN
jgi:hypothetical protein